MVRKTCMVPSCPNNSRDASVKIFLMVPRSVDRRVKWAEALGISVNKLHCGSRNAICEDHFDLEKDTTNWLFYKTIGKRLILKPNVVPHRALHNPPSGDSQFSSSARERKANVLAKIKTEIVVERDIPMEGYAVICTSELDDPLSLRNVQIKIEESTFESYIDGSTVWMCENSRRKEINSPGGGYKRYREETPFSHQKPINGEEDPLMMPWPDNCRPLFPRCAVCDQVCTSVEVLEVHFKMCDGLKQENVYDIVKIPHSSDCSSASKSFQTHLRTHDV